MKAKAQIKPEFKNPLEERFANIARTLQAGGLISAWRYEPFRVKLAHGKFYKVDWLFVGPGGEMILIETKGWHKNLRASTGNFKVAASLYPWFHWVFALERSPKNWRSAQIEMEDVPILNTLFPNRVLMSKLFSKKKV